MAIFKHLNKFSMMIAKIQDIFEIFHSICLKFKFWVYNQSILTISHHFLLTDFKAARRDESAWTYWLNTCTLSALTVFF